MERVQVYGSSTIESRGYDEEKRILEVSFINRKSPDHPNVYQYAGVPQSVWTDWLQAGSAGQFFAAQIKGHYPATRIQ
jgi:KTSC domain